MTATTPAWAHHITRVAVLTGAGISTASGIPDYRGPDGVWTRDPVAAAAFNYDSFLADPDIRTRFWRTYLDHPAWQATPNPAHEADPRCRACGGVLKLDTVLFGERLNPLVMGQAVSIASASPLLLAIGSSLLVQPAASLCRVAVDRGAHLVIVNRDPTGYDELATEVIRSDITQAVPELCDLLTA